MTTGEQYIAASMRVCKLRNALQAKRNELMRVATAAIDAQLADAIAEIDATAAQEAELKIQVDNETAAEALANPRYPIGTKLFEWTIPKWERVYKLSGRIGLFEIVTPDTVRPDLGEHSPIGTEIVRLLKNDLTPGKKYEPIRWGTWLPVDEQP